MDLIIKGVFKNQKYHELGKAIELMEILQHGDIGTISTIK
jgi:hypothetical protein